MSFFIYIFLLVFLFIFHLFVTHCLGYFLIWSSLCGLATAPDNLLLTGLPVEVNLSVFVADCPAWSKRFWLYLLLKLLPGLLPIFYPYFQQKKKINILSQIYDIYGTHQLITKVLFILSFICSGSDFCSVNEASVYENSESNFFNPKNTFSLVKPPPPSF